MDDDVPPQQRSYYGIWLMVLSGSPDEDDSVTPTWAVILLHKHLQPAARLAVFRTCKAARDMLLSTAKHLTVTLALAMEDPMHELNRLRALRSAIKTRGAQTTRIQFKLACVELWPLTQALGVMSEAGQWLEELEVEYQGVTLPVSVVTEIGRSYPNLTFLAIHTTLQAMPGPELLAQLQELHICPAGMEDTNLEQLYHTTQPYLSRLRRLAVGHMSAKQQLPTIEPPAPFPHLPLLLGPNPLSGLRRLELATSLDDELLGLLLHRVPALQTLAVSRVQLQGAHAHAECAWQCLECNGKIYLSSLARLPLPDGLVVMASEWVCDIVTAEDQAALRAPMAKVTCRTTADMHGVWLQPLAQLQTDHQPAALRVGLELLRTRLNVGSVNPPSRMWLELNGWTMSAGLISELQGLPRWASFGISGSRWVASDSLSPTTLLRRLPTSFRRAILPVDAPMIESICCGAPFDRHTAERPYIIKLHGDASRVQSVALLISKVIPNVIVGPV